MVKALTTKRRSAKQRTSEDMVTIRRAEYERLLAKAGEAAPGGEPALPKPDAQGNLPAVDYMRASIARELIRRRTTAGLSQVELAELAGVRRETVSRIESGKHTVGQQVMARIEKALLGRASRTMAQRRRGKRRV